MTMIRVNGTSVYYEDTDGGGPPIVFSHGLLWNTALFAPQIAALKNRYRCIVTTIVGRAIVRQRREFDQYGYPDG